MGSLKDLGTIWPLTLANGRFWPDLNDRDGSGWIHLTHAERTAAFNYLRLESRWGGWLPLQASQRQGGAVTQHELGATTMEIRTVDRDLAKNVFQVHAIGDTGEVIVRRSLRRAAG